MKRRAPILLALAAFAVWVGVETTNTVFILLTWHLDRGTFGESPQTVVRSAVTAGVFAGVGLLLASKRPRNAIGWLFLAIALNVAAGLDGAPANLFGRYALYSLEHGGVLPGAAVAATLAQAAWVIMISFVALLLLLFPNGRLPSRRWRAVVVLLVAAAAAAWVGGTMAPGQLDAPFGRYDNPLGVGLLGSPAHALFLTGGLLLLVPLFAAVASLIQRLRRSKGVERQQYALFTAAGLVLVVGMVATQVADALLGSFASNVVSIVPSVAAAVLPIATAVAILRYRLYEIDSVLSKTLVYGIADGAARCRVRRSGAGGTGAVLVVRGRVEPGDRGVDARSSLRCSCRCGRGCSGFVDRRFYRRRYDAQQTLAVFGSRLREQVDLETLSSELRLVVGNAMQPAHVSLWLQRPGSGGQR